MTATKILCDGTLKAACLILRQRGTDLNTIDAGELSAALKATLHSNIEQAMSEWKDATDAKMSEGWLRELMNAQCNDLALKALKSGGFIA